MNLPRLFVFIIVCFFTLTRFTYADEEQIYRWVDENGNVHFSDMPKSKNAKLFSVKQNNFAQPAVNQEELTANNQLLTEHGQSDFDRQHNDRREALYNIPPNKVLDEGTCQYLRAEIEKAREELDNGSLIAARQANVFINSAEKMLQEGRCH